MQNRAHLSWKEVGEKRNVYQNLRLNHNMPELENV